MGIFDKFKKSNTVNNTNSLGEDLEHLIDGELPWGWVAHKSSFIKPRDEEMIDTHVKACNAESVEEEKKLLERFLELFYAYKNECEQMGECYVKYFSDMHEHCHNSSSSDFSINELAEQRLAYINEHYDELIKKENHKRECLTNLDVSVWNELWNNPDIIQSNLIKLFDPIVKNEVASLLYEWDKSGRIIREKKGRSYILNIKKR
ncbi:MAG: hypothetical protein Q4C46_12085 [Bacillota bacterium]|nr:hypothetical protein [Bacillota bacterium]